MTSMWLTGPPSAYGRGCVQVSRSNLMTDQILAAYGEALSFNEPFIVTTALSIS